MKPLPLNLTQKFIQAFFSNSKVIFRRVPPISGIPNSVEVNEKGLFMFVSCLYGVCQMGLIPVTFNFGGELIYPEAEECSHNFWRRGKLSYGKCVAN